MTLGHGDVGRRFRSSGGPGGSRPGKPHGRWPLPIKVVADAVVLRTKGTVDRMVEDRTMMPEASFRLAMEMLLPGIWDWAQEHIGPRATSHATLLQNRVFKMYYSGTSDRGKRHDPMTRAAVSREHWHSRVPANDPLRTLHSSICSFRVIEIRDWRTSLLRESDT